MSNDGGDGVVVDSSNHISVGNEENSVFVDGNAWRVEELVIGRLFRKVENDV